MDEKKLADDAKKLKEEMDAFEDLKARFDAGMNSKCEGRRKGWEEENVVWRGGRGREVGRKMEK